jgi:hypothetical protein
MKFENFISKQLSLAYRIAGDLLTEVTLTKASGTTFSFSSATVTSSTETVVAKALIDAKVKKKLPNNCIENNLTFKTKDIGDISFYSSVTYGGFTWDLGEIIHNDTFITSLNVFRGA